MRVVLCDDDARELEHLTRLLQEIRQDEDIPIDLHSFTDTKKFLTYMARSQADIVLLDILMGETNGIQLAKILRQSSERCPIVFVTSSPDYGIEAFGVEAAHYLIKPVDKDRLAAALRRVSLLPAERKALQVVSDYVPMSVPLEQIQYIEAAGGTTQIHLQNGMQLVTYATLRQLQEQLAGEDRFIACQRSVILNADAVQSFSTARFRLKGGTEIAVPARRAAAVRQLYQQYLLDKVRGSKKILS